MTARQAQLLSGLLGLSAVALAAAGSHLVAGSEQDAAQRSWQAANTMHLVHALALLAVSTQLQSQASRALRFCAWSWVAGVVLFSGSLYLQAWLDLGGTSGIAPLGGILLMAGWSALAIAAWARAG